MSSQREHDEESPLLHTEPDVQPVKDLNASNQAVTTLRGTFIAISLGVLIFVQACNISLLTTTQSTIATELDAFAEVSWFTSSYLITVSSCTPLVGRLSQIFSPRNAIFVSTIILSGGALLTSQAKSLGVFLAGRAIAGVGGAGVFSIAIILVIELTPKKRRGLFVGCVNTGFTSGVALGAVIAGALLPVTGWRFLFWVQAPLILVSGLGVFYSIPKTFTTGVRSPVKETVREKLARIDYVGAVTLTGSLVLLLLSLSSAKITVLPILLSLLLLISFVLNEIYLAGEPIIPVNVLKSRGALLSCFGQVGLMMARWTVLFYTPVYAIAVRGWNPASAGGMLVPTNAGFAIGGLLAGWLHIRRTGSFYVACVITFSSFPISLLILRHLSVPGSSAVVYMTATFVNGLCTGAALNYTLAHILHLTHPSTHFIATSLLATFRGFAGSFGSAAGGGIFIRHLGGALEKGFAERGLVGKEELTRQLLGSPALVATLTGEEKEVALQGYVSAIQGLFVAAAALATFCIFVQAGTGWAAPDENEEPEETQGIA